MNDSNLSRRPIVLTMFMAALCLLAIASANATDAVMSKIYGIAIKGYDPVAYFTENDAVKGTSQYAYEWNEAAWYFSKPEHRDLFMADPEKYAPKHGGF